MKGKMNPERLAKFRESQRQNSLDLIKRLRARSKSPDDMWAEMANETEERLKKT
jgi:hypothetical protein